MINKKSWCLVLLILFSLLIACSNEDSLTGKTIDVPASTITVKVINETGQLQCGVSVYVNDNLKGETRCYGEGKGTKLLVLEGDNNVISVEKEGFISPEATSVSASNEGDQQMTFTLNSLKVMYEVDVVENEMPLEDALVVLYKDEMVIASRKTDNEGRAVFDKISNGNYRLKISKENYVSETFVQKIDLNGQGDFITRTIDLSLVPRMIIEVTDGKKDLNEVEVSLYTEKEYNSPGATPLHLRYTNREGKVTFDDVEWDNHYVLVFKKDNYEAQIIKKELISNEFHLEVEMIAKD